MDNVMQAQIQRIELILNMCDCSNCLSSRQTLADLAQSIDAKDEQIAELRALIAEAANEMPSDWPHRKDLKARLAAVGAGQEHPCKSEYEQCHSDLVWTGSGYTKKPQPDPRDQQIARLTEALRQLFDAIEMDDVPGYIYDAYWAECVACSRTAKSIEEVQHERGCFQAAIEQARAALAAPKPEGEKR